MKHRINHLQRRGRSLAVPCRRTLPPRGELLERREVLAPVGFAPHDMYAADVVAPSDVIAADLDGDGDIDIISASRFDNKIAWYENTDGQGTFGHQQIITTRAESARSVFAADLDGDGDIDILSGSSGDGNFKIAWYENTDGLGTFGSQRVINNTTDGGFSVYAADLDGDGDQDIIAASFNSRISWYENLDGLGNFGPQQVITTSTSTSTSVFATDLDSDGDLDVLSASWNDNKIAWYENTDGVGTFGPQQVITTNAAVALSVYAADLDGDGDQDVLSASRDDDKIAWYENTDGLGGFGPQLVITASADGAGSVAAADVDGDGDLDVLSASNDASHPAHDGKLSWYENMDGQGTFGTERAIHSDVHGAGAVFASDINGDGYVDAMAVSINTVAWYANADGVGSFGPAHVLTQPGVMEAATAISADVDGDGDLDALSASTADETIAWYENMDGHGHFGPQRVITTSDIYPANNFDEFFVAAADVDGDGDVDVLSAFFTGNPNDVDTIAWHENADGLGTFGPPQVITTSADRATSLIAEDVDGDGDVDVISGPAWYENTDGRGNFGTQQVIANATIGFAADLDGDGDVDVLDRNSWYENTDGQGSFVQKQVINFASPDYVHAADVDGDGDLDVVFDDGTQQRDIVWHENIDGLGTFGTEQTISTNYGSSIRLNAADLDGDGDVDILGADAYASYVWFENTDGLGTFGPALVIVELASSSVTASDFDGDGDVDLLAAHEGLSKFTWYENMAPHRTFMTQPAISTTAADAKSVLAADLDGDGDDDVLSASTSDNTIAWYENTDGAGAFGTQRVISTDVPGAQSVSAADLDGDGDLDVLAAAGGLQNSIAWFENVDGMGNFGSPRVVISDVVPTSAFAADLDGDGDLDVLSATWLFDNNITWYQNTDGLGTFGPPRVITTSAVGAKSVFAVDLDGDGDLDVLSASSDDGKIAWYENIDGSGTFGPQTVIDRPGAARDVYAADLDGDGDVDVLSASYDGRAIAWYENVGQPFFTKYTITRSAYRAESVHAADVDGDGDVDVVSASSGDNKIAWYENTDGLGSFAAQQVITSSADGPQSVFAADLDGDGDADVVSASGRDDTIAWYQSRPTVTGDFNGDGVYDLIDIDALVAVIAAGSHDTAFDMTGDGLIDLADRDAWLATAGAINLPSGNPYLLGDANLNGVVDGSDFGIWNAHKFTLVAAWSAGDFTANGVVDGSDFGIWNARKFTASGDVSRSLRALPRVEAATSTNPSTPRKEDRDSISLDVRLKMIDFVFADDKLMELG